MGDRRVERLRPGMTKRIRGKAYKLNKNSRWERAKFTDRQEKRKYKGLLVTGRSMKVDKKYAKPGVYKMNRVILSTRPTSIDNPISHTYLATVDKRGTLNTYGWGNTLTSKRVGRFHTNARGDKNAAKYNFRTGEYKRLSSDPKDVPRVRKQFLKTARENKNHHTWRITNNCKQEANKLWREVERKEDRIR